MSTINTLLIKRRLPDSPLTSLPVLSGGELAFSEKNYTLYYGASGLGSIAIGGNGAFVDRTTSQSIDGDKTFTGTTTLSSTTFSSDSVIDANSNKIINLAEPAASTDATTRNYVDTAISSLASSGGTATTSLSTEIYDTFVKLTEGRAVDLSGGLTVNEITATGNASVGGNLLVTGDLQVLGATTTIETETTTTSAFNITNHGGTTALTVTQVNGTNDVAEFKDGVDTALIIKGDGNVGVGTATPNEKLTISGNISASGNVFGVNGDFTGTLDIDGATSLSSTLTVTGASTFASTVSAQGALTVDGTSTLNDDVTVNDSSIYIKDSGTSRWSFNSDGSASNDIVAGASGPTFEVDASANVKLGSPFGMGATTVRNDATFDKTLTVTGASTFASTVSAHGALTVDGTSTFNDDVDVIDKVTVKTSNYVSGAAGGGIILDSANKKITVDDGFASFSSELTPSGIGSVANTNGFTISTVADAGAGIKLNPASGSHTNIQQGNLVGTGITELVNFVIDGGTF